MTRRAFTVIELLVSLGIAALLLSLTVAGVMSARESARTLSCSHHLRQIALASENYLATHGVYACGGLLGLRNLSHLLEGRPTRSLLNAVAYGFDPCNIGPCPEEGDWQRPAVYLCPTDPYSGRTARGASYRFCSGLSDLVSPPELLNGQLVTRSGPPGISNGDDFSDSIRQFQVRPADVTDGLSQTALASEQLLAHGDISTQAEPSIPKLADAAKEPLRHHWAIDRVRDLNSEFAVWEADCLNDPIDVRYHYRGSVYSHRSTTYTHTQRPNRRSCFNAVEGDGEGPIAPPTSLHRGGVNLVFADGHGRFIAGNIDLAVWRASGTRAGREEGFIIP